MSFHTPGLSLDATADNDQNQRSDLKSDPSRACDACRKMKIRCIDKENPPCKRCRHMDLECRFAPAVTVQRTKAAVSENGESKQRLDSLERQVLNMDRKLDDIASFLQRLPGMTSESPQDVQTPSSLQAGHRSAERPPGSHTQSEPRRYHAPRASGQESAERHGSLNFRARSLQFTKYDDDMAAMSPMNRLRPDAPDGLHDGWGQKEHLDNNNNTSHASRGDVSTSETITFDPRRGAEIDDPLEAAVRMEPFRMLTMKEEEARLRAEVRSLQGSQGLRDGSKRRRVSRDTSLEPGLEKDDFALGKDPVELGYCTEEEGKELFDAFFKYAHQFMPIFDPQEDTWHDLRARSPFCITVILLIALRGREGGNLSSELAKRCREHAETMAKMTLFSPIATLETVQALTVLASWCDSSWRPGCHAVTLAVDMGLFRCLPFLHRMSSGPDKPEEKLVERQRPLVIGARVWLALVKLTYEMSLTHALPLPFPCPAHYPFDYARELLEHPLSNISDARLVVSVEMLQVREAVFRPYEQASGDASDLESKLRAVNKEIQERFEYWIEYYRQRGISSDHFLVKELTCQRAYAIIYTNSAALYGVRYSTDIATLSFERKQWLGSALRAAAFLVSSIADGGPDKSPEFANHYFHVGAVSTARYLIRMVSILPEVCSAEQIGYDIDKLLAMLPTCHPFIGMLRTCMAKARHYGVLPPTSFSNATPLPEVRVVPALDKMAYSDPQQPVNPFPWSTPIHNPSYSGLDQLAQVGEIADLTEDSLLWLNDFNFAAWFPVASGDPGATDPFTIPQGLDVNSWLPGSWFPGPPG